MVWCSVCKKSLYDVRNLRNHAQKFHPNKIVEIAPKKSNCVKAVCNDCGKGFSEYSSLTRHAKKFHPDKINDIAPKKSRRVKVVCNDCGKCFSEYSSLTRHAKMFHPDKIDEIAPKKISWSKAACNECGKYFSEYSSFTRHVKRFHSDKINVLIKRKTYNYECGRCGKHFTHLRSLSYHLKKHNLWLPKSTKKKRQNLKCCLCKSEEHFEKDEILQHFTVVHDIKLFSDNLSFSDESEFYLWKDQIEIETKSRFINKHGSHPTKTYLKKLFICHRSGTYKPEGSGVRRLKAQGTNKINGYCPAEISLKVLENGLCEVNFQTVHVGHNQDLGHLTLSKAERETIAAKIAANIPFETIIDEVREESIVENKCERMHLLKKKDLYNIKQCFNLNNEAVWHDNDAVSLDDWVNEECILLEIPEDTLSETYDINDEEKKHMEELDSEKNKLKLHIMKLVDCIDSSEELTIVKKMIAPIERTLAEMKAEK